MKGLAVVFVAVIAGISAVPQTEIKPHQSRFVGDLIAGALEDVSQQIVDAGLDPWSFDKFDAVFALPVPVLLDVAGFIENIRVTGLSNIVINQIDYGLISSRLTLDISLPEISISLGGAAFDVTVLGKQYFGQCGGRLSIIEPRVSGIVQMNVGIITGIFVRDVDLEFDLQTIRFDGNANLFGVDYTSHIVDLVSNRIPAAIQELRVEIKELVEIIAWVLIEQIL